MAKSVCIIGAGISGLCTAYRLKRRGVDVTVFEKGEGAGGNIRSEKIDGFLIEHGPNSLLTSPQLLELVDELGLTEEIALANSAAKKRFILKYGKLAGLPTKFTDVIFHPPLSLSGMMRAMKEPFVRSRSGVDETVAEFFARRFGREVADYLLDPFVSGVYAGDPDRLSIKNAFPVLRDLEHDYGSVIRGFLRRPRNNSPKLPKHITRTVSFKNGLQTLTDRLRDELGSSLILGKDVQSIREVSNGKIDIISDEGAQVFDAVVVSTPSHVAAKLIESIDVDLSANLSRIEYPPIAVVYSGYKKSEVGFDPAGFGFLVPGLEKRRILGSLWTSSVFAGRAPDGYHLMTTFIGGARNSDFALEPDDALVETTHRELADILNIKGRPVFSKVKKWPRAIPQYNVGYDNVLSALETFREQNPAVFFCNNFHGGISVGDCIKNSAKTADGVFDLIGNG